MKAFKDIVKSILNDKELIIALSDRFHISQSTVKRWANGVSNPHPVIKAEVIRYINDWK